MLGNIFSKYLLHIFSVVLNPLDSNFLSVVIRLLDSTYCTFNFKVPMKLSETFVSGFYQGITTRTFTENFQ